MCVVISLPDSERKWIRLGTSFIWMMISWILHDFVLRNLKFSRTSCVRNLTLGNAREGMYYVWADLNTCGLTWTQTKFQGVLKFSERQSAVEARPRTGLQTPVWRKSVCSFQSESVWLRNYHRFRFSALGQFSILMGEVTHRPSLSRGIEGLFTK